MSENKTEIREAWNIWRECLSSKDTNSIYSQISYMLWDTAIFQLILESRRLQSAKHAHIPELNSTIALFIDRNYFESQVAGIRRQTDNFGLYGKRGVFSLRSLLNDLSKKRLDFDRLTFIQMQNLNESDWVEGSEVHYRFDKLSRVLKEKRTNSDVFSDEILHQLQSKLDTCNQITLYVDKYIAHSATPESRILSNLDETGVTFGEIWKAQKLLYQVMEFLSESLYSMGLDPFPLEYPTMFLEPEMPILDTSSLEKLQSTWVDFRIETNTWKFNGSEDLWKWLDESV
jgi:hypothetical protein